MRLTLEVSTRLTHIFLVSGMPREAVEVLCPFPPSLPFTETVSLSSSKLTEHKEWGVTGTPIYKKLEALGSTRNYPLALCTHRWLPPGTWQSHRFGHRDLFDQHYWGGRGKLVHKAGWTQDEQNCGCPQCASPQAGCLPLTKTSIYTKCLLFSHWPVTSQQEKNGTRSWQQSQLRDGRD